MDTLITNCWGKAAQTPLQGTHCYIYKASSWDAAYSHHPQLAYHQGKLFATWSLGHLHEDTPGQQMVFATSDNLGKTWSAPRTLVAPTPGQHAPGCITSLGILVTGDLLAAYYASYEFTLEGMKKYMEFGANSRGIHGLQCLQQVHTGVMSSIDGGETWQGPISRIPGIIPNLSPVRISTGHLIFPAFHSFPYTDDPQGLNGWKIASLPDLPPGYYDGAGGHIPLNNSWSHLGICEGSVYEMPDGILRMMLRTCKGILAVSLSTDQGQSWSAPQPTQFTDCGCRFQFGRLPNGRYFALSCPDPNIPTSCLRRTPLVLATSQDGNTFSQHYILGDEPDMPLRYPGGYKHGRYGYPYSYVLGNNLFIINSVGKEDIEFHTFNLSDIA